MEALATPERRRSAFIEYMAKLKQLGKMERLCVAIYVVCFLCATVNHLNDVRSQGFLPYKFAPIYLNFFWTSLTIIDPLAAILLLTKVRIGLYLSIVVILMDISVNIPYFFFIAKVGSGSKGIVLSQIIFAFFLFHTFPVTVHRVNNPLFLQEIQ